MSKVKCLLVDDLEENLLVLQALLRRDDVELLLARSGVEALDLLLTHEVALALVDVQMPEMDGFELAELMRGSERTRHVPLIFVTAGARDQYRVFKGYDSGAVDFLFKPIEPVILRNKAEVFFQLYRQKQQIEQELHERTETLRMHEMFAAVLGHDLRAPLSAIVTSAQLLPRISNEPEVHAVAQRLQSSGRRMTRMIEDLLDLTRARLGGGIPIRRRGVTDLSAVLQHVLQELGAAIVDRTVAIHAEGNLEGDWDAERIAQVFANLIGNAIQHGTAGTAIAIRLEGAAPGFVTMSVTNDGAPEPASMGTLFDPFKRGRRDPSPQEGLGLGLYIARQIVEAHGGTITVAIVDPNQTVFTCTLPRRAAA